MKVVGRKFKGDGVGAVQAGFVDHDSTGRPREDFGEVGDRTGTVGDGDGHYSGARGGVVVFGAVGHGREERGPFGATISA